MVLRRSIRIASPNCSCRTAFAAGIIASKGGGWRVPIPGHPPAAAVQPVARPVSVLPRRRQAAAPLSGVSPRLRRRRAQPVRCPLRLMSQRLTLSTPHAHHAPGAPSCSRLAAEEPPHLVGSPAGHRPLPSRRGTAEAAHAGPCGRMAWLSSNPSGKRPARLQTRSSAEPGRKLGRLRSARQGLVRVPKPNTKYGGKRGITGHLPVS